MNLSRLTSFPILLLLTTQTFTLTAQRDYQQAVDKFTSFYNHQQADSVFSLFAPSVQAMLPLDKTAQMVRQLHAQFGDLQSTTVLKQDANAAQYKSVFTKTTLIMALALDSGAHLTALRFLPYQPEQAGDKPNTNFSFKTPDGTIYGTLLMPQKKQKVPVVLIIAGSGPTDRNGNSTLNIHTDSYRMLADSLVLHGIASLRYDKRGVGESEASTTKPELETKFEDMIDDAVGILKTLKTDDRFSRIIVLGHSEGSLVGMVAAKGNADAYISLAGAGQRADKDIEAQLLAQSPQLAAKATLLFDSLSAGYTVQEPGPDLNSLFRASVQPYVISWLRHDPQQEIARLQIPILIIQGTTDIQVNVADAERLKNAAPRAKLVLIEGMNHILKQAPADRQTNIATYNVPTLPLKPELIQAIDAFILSI